jgi:carbamoyl-phosphate synthase small subunit
VVATDGTAEEKLIAEAQALPTMAGLELASRVTSKEQYEWSRGSIDLATAGTDAERGFATAQAASAAGVGKSKSATDSSAGARYKVVAYDFGIKQNILRLLVDYGCNVTVVPAQTSAEDVLALKPQGVFLSNGPGDPEPIGYAVGNIRKMLGRVPIFGICLGHQLCGLALGGRTFKLKFGHHGSNHPVQNLRTRKVEITSQNHGFCVDPDSLPASDVEITHVNLNDHTNEGMRHRSLPLFSVQYHPEASPGPHDARYLFDDFISLMKEGV